MADINKIIAVNIDDNASSGLKKVEKNITEVTQATKTMTKETKNNTQATLDNGGAMGLLNELTGGLAMTFKDASEAIGLAGVSLNSFKGIMLATGIGAFVLAIGYLAENWDKVTAALDRTTAAQRAYNQAILEADISTKQTKVAVESLYNQYIKYGQLDTAEQVNKANAALTELANNIGSLSGLKFTLGDEKENAKVLALVKEAVDGFKEYNNALVRREELQKQLNDAIREQREAEEDYVKWQNKSGLKGSESTYGDPMREAQKKVKDLTYEFNNLTVSLVEQSAKYKIIENSVKGYTKSLEENEKQANKNDLANQARLDKLAKLIESYRIKTEDLDDKTDLAKIDRAEKRAIAELNLLKGTEEQKRVITEYYDRLRMEAIDKEYEANKEKQKKAAGYLFDGLKKELDEQLARSKALIDIKAMQNEAMLVKDIEYWEDVKSIATAAESFMSALQDDQLIRGQGLRDALLLTEKGFAVAQVWLSEAQSSATAKFNASMVPATVQAGPYTIPNPMKPVAMASAARAVITNKISAGIATAAILAQTISGLNKRGSGGGGGTSEGSVGGGTPQAQFNMIQSSGTNQLAATIGAQQNMPVQTYVVGSDVATENALTRNRITTATFL